MSDDPFGDALAGMKPEAAAAPKHEDDPFGAALAALPAGGQPQPEQDKGPAPSWGEIPGQALSNAPHSAIELAKNVATPFIHPIETAKNLGNIGLGYMEKAGSAVGLPGGQGYEQYADAVNKMVADRYGSMDNFKRTLATDPVGAAADLSAVLTGGGGLAAKAPGMLGRAGEIAGAVGSAVDPLNAVAKPVMGAVNAGIAIAKHGIGHLSAGSENLGALGEAGFKSWERGSEAAQEARENMRGEVPIERPVKQAMGAIDNIVTGKNNRYQADMAQAGLTQPISPSSWTRIAKGIRDAGDVDKFDLISSVRQANNHLSELVSDFMSRDPATHHTVEGLDALKQEIGIYRNTLDPKAAVVAHRYYDAVEDAITQQAPGYAKIMENYHEAKNLLGELQKSLSLPQDQRKLNVDTALRKLQSVMRNNVNTNYGYRTTLLKHLEENGAPNIKYALAGQAANTATPRGLGKIASGLGTDIAAGLIGLFTGHPGVALGALKAAAVTAAATSPRLAGEAAYYAGKIAKPVSKVLNRPVARAANQLGKMDAINIRPITEARGGAVERALRAVKRK